MAGPAKQQAVSQPQFIIQSSDGKVYYLTVSLWAYEPGATGNAKADIAARQADATTQIVDTFNTLLATPGAQVKAVQVPDGAAQAYMAMIT